MRSEPSRGDGMDDEVSSASGVEDDSAAPRWSFDTFSKKVADGAKNRFPVTARLKSSKRS